MSRHLVLLVAVCLAPSAAGAPTFPIDVYGEHCTGDCELLWFTLYEDGRVEDHYGVARGQGTYTFDAATGTFEIAWPCPTPLFCWPYPTYTGVLVPGTRCAKGSFITRGIHDGAFWFCAE